MGTAELPRGLALGDGGIASPRRGARPPGLEPGMAGRRRGTGDDIVGAGLEARWGSVKTGFEGFNYYELSAMDRNA